MALILKIKDATFSKFVRAIAPPVNPYAWFDFGTDFATSVTDKSGNGINLTGVGVTTGITYTAYTVILPQTSATANCLGLAGLAGDGSYTIAGKMLTGQYERIAMFPGYSSIGLLVDSGGLMQMSVITSEATKIYINTASPISRPIKFVASVDVSVSGKITIKLITKDDFGIVSSVSQTFDASPDASYSTQALRLGSNAIGRLELDEMIFYRRALSDAETDQLISYLELG